MEQGVLKRGDQILSVNSISLEGLSHQEAVNILKNCEGTVNMQILSWTVFPLLDSENCYIIGV